MDASFDPAPYRCYAAPYGTVGIVCDFLSMYTLYMVFVCGHPPLVFFRRLKHTTWAMWFFGIKAVAQSVIHWFAEIQPCAPESRRLTFFEYDFIELARFSVGPMLVLWAVLARWGNDMDSSAEFTASTKHTHGRSQPGQSLAPSSASASPSILEPPPACRPRPNEDSGDATQGGFEMQSMSRRDIRAVADAAPENYPEQGFAESPRMEEGGEGPGTRSDNSIPPWYDDNDDKMSSQSQQRHGPCRMPIRPPLLVSMLFSTVLLLVGTLSLIDGLPIGFFDGRERTAPEGWQYDPIPWREWSWSSKGGAKHEVMMIHLAVGIIGFVVSLLLSAYVFCAGVRARAGQRARVRDYCVELFKRGRVSNIFWTIIIATITLLCFGGLFVSNVLIGYAAFDKRGLRQFEGDQDAGRYWLYFGLGLLPLLSS